MCVKNNNKETSITSYKKTAENVVVVRQIITGKNKIKKYISLTSNRLIKCNHSTRILFVSRGIYYY